jgi:phosphatidylserine/phosphatidylglycerophosphate/cardiolipin synthase-like enzyme
MRKRIKQTGAQSISVNAIAGTYVVLLGMNASASARKGLLGFAIERNDKTEKEKYWLKGFKTFKQTAPNSKPGTWLDTALHPIQAFLWGDYTAKPDHDYVYKIVPIYGTPANPTQGKAVEVNVKTESEDKGKHAIYFNRGAAGSQAYARKFGNKPPGKPGSLQHKWLSRGAEEAILNYIGRAKGKEYSIRAAVYEFSWLPVLKAFGAASESGADVKIVYDCRKESPQSTSKKAIKAAGIDKLMIPRRADKNFISHNKFIILLKNGKPVEVLTGSTNFTEGGIFGQSNVVHIVRDAKIAAKYFDYWKQLSQDVPANELREWNVINTPDPQNEMKKNTITAVFSPRPNLTALEWYSGQMNIAKSSSGFTAAFGVNKVFENVMKNNNKNFRYVMLEKEGSNHAGLLKNPNNQIVVGAVYGTTAAVGDAKFQFWLKEKLTGLNTFVKYLHTKYLFVDPLSDNPTIISGSANFSDASTKNNDENMLIIQGDTMVADVYLGEFMRLWSHFYFRNIANLQALKDPKKKAKTYLAPDDSWTDRYYGKGDKVKERELFA